MQGICYNIRIILMFFLLFAGSYIYMGDFPSLKGRILIKKLKIIIFFFQTKFFKFEKSFDIFVNGHNTPKAVFDRRNSKKYGRFDHYKHQTKQ
jgi:hypothetical protein